MFWQYFIGSIVFMIVTYVTYVYYYKKHFIILTETLYAKKDVDKYLRELDRFPSTIFFPKKHREMMKIDAYMMIGKNNELKRLFETLNNTSLRPNDKFFVYQKEVAYYSNKKNVKKVKEAFEKMKDVKTKIKAKSYEKYDNALVEVEYIIALLEKEGKYAKDLEKKGEEAGDTLIAGTYFYKAAQSYYYNKDEKNIRNCLEKALKHLKGTTYEGTIKKMLNTNNFRDLDS